MSRRRKSSIARAACALCAIALGAALTPRAFGQAGAAGDQGSPGEVPPAADEAVHRDCKRCHSCDRPTVEDICLPFCTRRGPREPDDFMPDYKGPDVVILDELEKAYLPVPFDHKGHARMAEMSFGCVTCHHYTPEGHQHPACKTCHEVEGAGTDIIKPGLKGAYHRQCLNCHKDWIDETDCVKCHLPKTVSVGSASVEAIPTKDDVLGQMHPPVPEPDTEIYRAGSGRATETQVIFRHREHVHRFGLTCAECHHEETCSRCHLGGAHHKRPRTLAEHHRPCVVCHKDDMEERENGEIAGKCERCHWREGQPRPAPFEHASTGWPLSRFHEGKSCRACHPTVPFSKADRKCMSCHSNWHPSTFDHRVTKQVLDENHAELDCDSCHTEHKFDRPPTCDACHDAEDDGIAFPARRPGPLGAPLQTSRRNTPMLQAAVTMLWAMLPIAPRTASNEAVSRQTSHQPLKL